MDKMDISHLPDMRLTHSCRGSRQAILAAIRGYRLKGYIGRKCGGRESVLCVTRHIVAPGVVVAVRSRSAVTIGWWPIPVEQAKT